MFCAHSSKRIFILTFSCFWKTHGNFSEIHGHDKSFFLYLLQVLRSCPRATPHPYAYCRISRYMRYSNASQSCTKCRPSGGLKSIPLYSLLPHLQSPSFEGMPRVGNHLDARVNRSSWNLLSLPSTFFSDFLEHCGTPHRAESMCYVDSFESVSNLFRPRKRGHALVIRRLMGSRGSIYEMYDSKIFGVQCV